MSYNYAKAQKFVGISWECCQLNTAPVPHYLLLLCKDWEAGTQCKPRWAHDLQTCFVYKLNSPLSQNESMHRWCLQSCVQVLAKGLRTRKAWKLKPFCVFVFRNSSWDPGGNVEHQVTLQSLNGLSIPECLRKQMALTG